MNLRRNSHEVRALAWEIHERNGHPDGYDGPCWGPTLDETDEAFRALTDQPPQATHGRPRAPRPPGRDSRPQEAHTPRSVTLSRGDRLRVRPDAIPDEHGIVGLDGLDIIRPLRQRGNP